MVSSSPSDQVAHDRWVQENQHRLTPHNSPWFYKHTNCGICKVSPGTSLYKIPSEYEHLFYAAKLRTAKVIGTSGYGGPVVTMEGGYTTWQEQEKNPCEPEDATLVSSRLKGLDGDTHTVMLDLDIPAWLVPSSTEGHSHLYIDRQLSWRQYKKLLRALAKAGIIEKGYYGISVKRKATMLRPPWVKK